ncbi:MAG: hypothetical protein C4306_06310 [Thermoleophilia bacterium]
MDTGGVRPTGASSRMERGLLAALSTALSELVGRRGRLAANALIPELMLAVLAGAAASGARPLVQPLGSAVAALAGARLVWVWAAASAFAWALVCSASARRSALGSCGTAIGRLDAVARYGVGSLVNSILPGHAGGAARIVLFSQAVGAYPDLLARLKRRRSRPPERARHQGSLRRASVWVVGTGR